MGVYEIGNPSDKATFEAPNDRIAVLAVLVLGEGRYAALNEDGENVGGMSLFGWSVGLTEKYGLTQDNLVDEIKANATAIAEALESILYIGMGDRAALKAAGGDPRKFNEAKRTSLNNMSSRAFAIAARLRKAA